MPQIQLSRSSSQPNRMGKILKGKNYDNDKLTKFTKDKLQ